MPTILRIPELTSGATHAALLAWKKNSGDAVAAGECLAEIETDKAVMELIAEHGGTLGRTYAKAGDEVQSGGAIGELLQPGEEEAAQPLPPRQPPPIEASTAASTLPSDVDVPERPIGNVDSRLRASPLARRIARDMKVDLGSVKGTGPYGRIVRADVESAVAARRSDAVAPQIAHSSAATASVSYREVPHTGMRKTIARRLSESKATVPHFYLKVRCDMDRLLELRASINEAADRKISINDFVVRAVALALREVPQANVGWTEHAMRQYASADVAVAVSVGQGLFTPVVRRAETKTLSAISAEIADFAERARAGKLAPEEYQGGNFSVSNLGMFGVEEFSAVIDPTQSAILAVGAVEAGVSFDGDSMRVARLMCCTLSVDHRAIDGALAAKWLASFKRLIENPLQLLV